MAGRSRRRRSSPPTGSSTARRSASMPIPKPGDGVVLMTPVYHAFARVIAAAGRRVVECPLAIEDGRYVLDIAGWDAQMTGSERMLILCSPHNPGGRVWTRDELREIADFCTRHDLILVSDEIHHDLVMPGHRHTVMPLAAPEIAGPAGDDDRHHQDLQHRRRPYRQRHHPRRGAARRLSRPA